MPTARSEVALPLDAVPRLWRLARIDYDPARQRPVLLYPEGAVLLNDTGRAILELVDGRHTVDEIAVHARSLGLYTTLVTSGLGLTRKRAEALRAAGLEHVQVSVQDADPAIAERIAGVSSVKQKQAAIALVKELGFAFSVNVVLHRANLDRIGEIIDMAAGYGADRLELANTQYYGWGLKKRALPMP